MSDATWQPWWRLVLLNFVLICIVGYCWGYIYWFIAIIAIYSHADVAAWLITNVGQRVNLITCVGTLVNGYMLYDCRDMVWPHCC